MAKVKVTLAVGIALTAAVVAFALTRAPSRVLRRGEPLATTILGVTQREPIVCQGGETVPAGVTAIRLSTAAFFGTNLQVVAYHDGRVLTQGARGPQWSGTSATVRIAPIARTTSNVTLCVAVKPNSQMFVLFGRNTPARTSAVALGARTLGPAPPPIATAQPIQGRLNAEYLAPGQRTWWSRVGSVITDMGYGHFISGSWVALLAALLMAAVGVLTARLALREQT